MLHAAFGAGIAAHSAAKPAAAQGEKD